MEQRPENPQAGLGAKIISWVLAISIAAIILAVTFRVVRWIAGF